MNVNRLNFRNLERVKNLGWYFSGGRGAQQKAKLTCQKIMSICYIVIEFALQDATVLSKFLTHRRLTWTHIGKIAIGSLLIGKILAGYRLTGKALTGSLPIGNLHHGSLPMRLILLKKLTLS